MKNSLVAYKVTKVTDGYIAQCTQNPAIIVHAASKSDVKGKMQIATQGYLEAFPKDKKNVVISSKNAAISKKNKEEIVDISL